MTSLPTEVAASALRAEDASYIASRKRMALPGLSFRERAKIALQKTSAYKAVRRFRDDAELGRWVRAGRPAPPPAPVKHAVLREYARRFGLRALVETGTNYGHTVEALREEFDPIYSIELDDWLFERALRRFHGNANVHLLHGDSAQLLPRVLEELKAPALFWLDGHFSGEGTAKGLADTPVCEELDWVLRHAVSGHVILIDDARLLGTSNYPTAEALAKFVVERRPEMKVEIAEDITRIHDGRARGRDR